VVLRIGLGLRCASVCNSGLVVDHIGAATRRAVRACTRAGFSCACDGAEPVPGLRAKLLAAMGAVSKRGPRPDSITEKMWASYSQLSFDTWRDRLANLKQFDLILHERYAPRKTSFGEESVETYLYRLTTTTKQVLYIEFQMNREGQIVLQVRRDY